MEYNKRREKLQHFHPQRTPKDRLLIVYFKDWGFRIARYARLGDSLVWRLQVTEEWHDTKDTLWCELPMLSEGHGRKEGDR